MTTTIQDRGITARQGAGAAALAALSALLLCTCSFSWTSAQVTSAQLATAYRQGKAVNPTSMFSPSDHVLHLVVLVANAPNDTKLGASWYVVDAGGHRDEKLDSARVTLNGDDRVDFTLSNNANWPRGQYKVDVMLNGKRDRTLNFEVR